MVPPLAKYELVGFKKKNGDLGTALPNSLACSLNIFIRHNGFKKLCVYYACVPEVSADCDNFFTCGQESTCRHVLGKEGKTK